MRSLQARTGLSQLHPASSGVRAPFIFSALVRGTPHHSVLAIFRRGYTLGEEDEECSDVVLLSRPAVFSGGPVGWFFRRARPSAGQPENEAAWYRSVRSGLSRFKDGGGYKANRQALEALVQKACRWDAKAGKPVFLIQKPGPPSVPPRATCFFLKLWKRGIPDGPALSFPSARGWP